MCANLVSLTSFVKIPGARLPGSLAKGREPALDNPFRQCKHDGVNETLRLIMRRATVRTFSDRFVERETRETVLEAAMRAPTAGNLMAYSIIEVEDPGKKERLAETCDDQPFIAKAPLVLLFLADYRKLFDLFRASGVEERCAKEGRELRSPGPGELFISMSDALVAAHTAVLAGESLGLASCYIGDIFEHFEEHRRLFELPDFVFPAALLVMGYPKGSYPPENPVPRSKKEYVCFTDTYRRFSSEEILTLLEPTKKRFFAARNMPEDTANIGIHVWKKKYDSDFMREMERSLFKALSCWLKRAGKEEQ